MRGTGMFILILWIGLSGMIACTNKVEDIEAGSEGDKELLVRLVVTKPNSGGRVVSDPETEISEIQLLVFEEGAYKYRVPGISITNTGTATSFTARLTATEKALDLYIVANATAAVLANEPGLGASENEVRSLLQDVFPVSGTFTGLPMFGHHQLASGIQPDQLQEISGVKMLRAIARVDVLLGNVPDFELTSMQAFRANSRIQVIADQDASTVTTPSVPAGSQMNINTTVTTVSGNQAMAELYLPESVSPAESEQVAKATCVVVGGKYGGSDEVTYYRIDFDPDNVNNRFGEILRNHRYIFTIQHVAGPGWPSADEAANNRSAQINLNIQAWDESTTDMYFDTEHHFGVSAREIVLESKQNASATVQVSTDLSDYTMQWSDEQGNVSGTAAESLSNSYFKIEKTEGGGKLVVTALQANSGNNTERNAYFVITVSRWRILMTVRQLMTDVSGRTINLLSFRSYLGNLGVNLLLPTINPESRGAGTSGILSNLSNFGPAGTVICGGYNLMLTNVSTSSISESALAVADVIYFNYVRNGDLTAVNLTNVRQWLEADTKRVLIISFDYSDVNVPILKEFLGNSLDIQWFATNNGPFPLVKTSATAYFTTTGPFTVSPYAPLSDGFQYQNYDIYHGEINSGSAGGITPLLNGKGGGIVLGIDMSNRIVYMGDIDIFSANNGTGSTTENHINNTKGTINNDASKLIANLFAWITGIVLGD